MVFNGLYYPLTIMLKLTDFCSNNCLNGRYCFARNSPKEKTWIDIERSSEILQEAKEVGFREVAYVSTEPFSDISFLVNITKKARDAGISPRFLVTNGGIGMKYGKAVDSFKRVKDAGFDFSVDKNYLGTGYNGIDVSADQFHKIPTEWIANTILAALQVFGPTIFVSIRTTEPSEKRKDPTTLNSVIRHLQKSGSVKGINRSTCEIVFYDGSRVKVNQLHAEKLGLAEKQPDDFFRWRNFRLEELGEYKDLREFVKVYEHPLRFHQLPYHRLYIDPSGETFPELGRFKVLSGGNVYNTSVREVIENIRKNSLVSLLISRGLAGFLHLLSQQFGVPLDLRATGQIHLAERYFSQNRLIDGAKKYVKDSGLEERLIDETAPQLRELRMLYKKNVTQMIFEQQVKLKD